VLTGEALERAQAGGWEPALRIRDQDRDGDHRTAPPRACRLRRPRPSSGLAPRSLRSLMTPAGSAPGSRARTR
jgi:hypothetical protein